MTLVEVQLLHVPTYFKANTSVINFTHR